MEEKEFRYDVWKLGGLLDRQRFLVTTIEGKAQIQEERQLIEKIKEKVELNPFFAKLSDPRKKDARKGKWRLGKQWVDIAENSGAHKAYFISLYAYLSSFAHSSHLGVLQLSQAYERHLQAKLAVIYTSVNLTLMSHFIIAYCSFFRESQAFLDSHEEYKNFVQTYYITAEDWDDLIRKA